MLGVFTSQDVGFGYGGYSCIQYGGYIYQFCGANTAGASTGTSIRSAKILEDGSLGLASVVGLTPVVNGTPLVIVYNGQAFLSGASGNAIYRYVLGTGGAISDPKQVLGWTAESNTINGATQAFLVGDYIYLVRSTGLWAAKMTSDGPQQLQLLSIIGNTLSLAGCRLLVSGKKLIAVGGNIGATLQTAIYSADIDGFSAKNWRMVAGFPLAWTLPSALVIDDKLIVFGGQTASGNPNTVTTIYRSGIDKDGNINGNFTITGALAAHSRSPSQHYVATKNFLYVIGGVDGSGVSNVNVNTVQYARIIHGI